MALKAMNPIRRLLPSTLKTLAAGITFSSILVVATIANAQNTITNGLGEYREFNKPTLLIKLDLTSPTSDALSAVSMDRQKELSFRILEDRSIRSWSQIWIQNLSINNPPTILRDQADDLIRMTKAIPSKLTQGDLVAFKRLENDLTVMTVDGVELEQFETPNFFEFLLSAFIGTVPPSSKLKSSLLQDGEIRSEDKTRFASLDYSNERSRLVASWRSPQQPAPVDIAVNQNNTGVVATKPTAKTASEDLVGEATTEAVGTEAVGAEAINTDIASEANTEIIDIDVAAEKIDTAPKPSQDMVQEYKPIEQVAVKFTKQAEEIKPGYDALLVPTSLARRTTDPVITPALAPTPDDEPIHITAETLLVTQNFQRQVLLSIYQNMEYPSTERRLNREGSVRVSFDVNEDGSLGNVALLQEAKYSGFNKAALAAIDSTPSFKDLTDSALNLPMTIELPIQFKLQ